MYILPYNHKPCDRRSVQSATETCPIPAGIASSRPAARNRIGGREWIHGWIHGLIEVLQSYGRYNNVKVPLYHPQMGVLWL